jgi:hypothetical protein
MQAGGFGAAPGFRIAVILKRLMNQAIIKKGKDL